MGNFFAENWFWAVLLIAILIAVFWGFGRAAGRRENPYVHYGDLYPHQTGAAPVKTVEAAPQPAPAPAAKTVAPVESKTGRDELRVDNIEKAAANPIASAKPAATAAPAAAPEGKPKIAAAVGEPDNLRQIKGVGPKLNTLLGSLGVTRFDQIAAWGEAEIAEVDGYLGTFKGRVTRDNWVDQAGYLAKGDIAGFEAKYGKMLKG